MKTTKTIKRYFIKDLEKRLGIYREKIFYWERTGKIPVGKREPMSNYRYWTEADVKAIKNLLKGR